MNIYAIFIYKDLRQRRDLKYLYAFKTFFAHLKSFQIFATVLFHYTIYSIKQFQRSKKIFNEQKRLKKSVKFVVDVKKVIDECSL